MSRPRRLGVYEHRTEPLLSLAEFRRRLVRHAAFAALLVVGSLAIGILGFRLTEGYTWIDCILNASMLLGGMGQVGALTTTAGKLFASVFAIYSGLMVLAIAGLIAAPVAHRILHRLHLQSEEAERPPRG